MMIRLLVGLLAGLLLVGANAAPPTDLDERIANLKAQKLEAAVIRLETGETAVARIYGYRDLELLATGSARTFLFGNPNIIITAFEDSAELHKEQE